MSPKFKVGDVLKIHSRSSLVPHRIRTISEITEKGYIYDCGAWDQIKTLDQTDSRFSYFKVERVNHWYTKLGKVLYK